MPGGQELVAVEFKLPNYLDRFKGQFRRVQIAIASDIQTNVGLRFDNEGAYNGHQKWKDLASGLNRKKAKNGLQVRQILRKSGALKNSIGPASPTEGVPPKDGYITFSGDIRRAVVRVGSRLKYAAIHNNGGVINHPGTSNGFGRGIKIPPHKIRIPRRNFTDWSQQDNKNLQITLKNTIEEIISGR